MLLLQLWGGARSRILTTLKRFAALLAPGVGAESTEMEQPLVRFNTASRVFLPPRTGAHHETSEKYCCVQLWLLGHLEMRRDIVATRAQRDASAMLPCTVMLAVPTSL
jgi:hypothetical protein